MGEFPNRIQHENCESCGRDLACLPEVVCPRCKSRYHSECFQASGCVLPACVDPFRIGDEFLPVPVNRETLPVTSQPKASCSRRTAAFLMDAGLACTVGFACGIPAWLLQLGSASALSCMSMGVLLTALANEVVLNGIRGASVGKKAMGIKVTDSQGDPPGLTRAFLREIPGKWLSSTFYGLGFLVASLDPETRALHDRLSGTWVIEAET